MPADAIRAAFRNQADWCRTGGAPFMAVLCDALAAVFDETSATGRAVLGWPGVPHRDALMMRVTGGLNALVRAGNAPAIAPLYPPAAVPDAETMQAALRLALADPAFDAALLPWLDGPPQTNEVGRSGVLMPGLMAIAATTGFPLRLFELGASAGLNLQLDRFHYTLAGIESGPAEAGVRLAPKWRGGPPPAADVRVIARRKVDIAPLDAADPATAARLLAYIWPDQPERVARATAAIAVAAANPPPLDRADAAAWVEAQVTPEAGSTGVVYHSIAFQYFPADSRARIEAHLEAAGARATPDAPLAWLRYEFDNAEAADALPTLRLRLWRGGAADERLLARVHPHGTFVEWLA